MLFANHTSKLGLRSRTTSAVDWPTTTWSNGIISQPEADIDTIDRPLVTYVYSESEESRRNFEFFIAHGLHSQADFIFIFNGETNAPNLLPDVPEIGIVRRNNTCYDLGAHAEVLNKDDLWKRYKKFILMNSSVRGPFMPTWTDGICWTNRLLSKITSDVKVRLQCSHHTFSTIFTSCVIELVADTQKIPQLVGTSINCWPTPHVQSMVWATDSEGMGLLLHPPLQSPRHDVWMEKLFTHAAVFPRPDDYKPADLNWVEKGLSQCFTNRQKAVEAEISATGIILGANKKVDVLLTKYQTTLDHNAMSFCEPFEYWDPQAEGGYDGANIHPYESMFIKTNRGISPRLIDNLSKWTDESRYSSYDQCLAYPSRV